MRQFFSAHPTLLIAGKVILILLGTALISGILRAAINRVGAKLEKREKKLGGRVTRKMMTKFLMALIYVLGIITAVNQIPTLAGTLRTVLAGSGVLAVVIGFAAQESFGNLISGVFLSIFKPFDVGDLVTLTDRNITGYVEDITLRHTVLRTPMDTRALIPNAVMGSAVVENRNYIEEALIQVPVQVDVAYDTDLDLAVRVLREALASHPLCAGKAPPKALVTGFAASGVSLLGLLPIRDVSVFSAAASEARILVKQAFDRNGIQIPYQTITIANLSDTPEK